jgi:hypothetical protein
MRVPWPIVIALAACAGPDEAPTRPAPMPNPDERPSLVEPGPHSPRIAGYRIDATLDSAAKRIAATETIRWRNTGTEPVSELPLHLYMNAFKNEQSVFMKESRGHHRRAKMAKDRWGWIEVPSIKLDGVELRPQAKFGVDETVLTVPLPRGVAPGEEIAVDLTFTTQLPEVFARTGYKGEFIMVAQWFPKPGVLVTGADGKQAWHCEPFHVNSEFFADFGVYDVTLTVPETHVVAATGVLTAAESLGGGKRKLVYRAEDVHDFAWMADPYMTMISTTAETGRGKVEVRVYHRPDQAAWAKRHLEAGKRSIEGFSRLFYPYPWTIMSILSVPPAAMSGAGGMEYPMIVTTGGDGLPDGLYIPEEVTVHEVGHNWFQGLLASNEVDEAWLDEGVNSYADGLILDEWLGADRSVLDLWGLRVGYYDLHRWQLDPDDLTVPIATKSYEFPTNAQYGSATYTKTAQALRTLEEIVGRDRFLAALKVYATKWAFKHPTRADLFAVLNEELGDVSWFLEPAFLSTGAIDYRIARAESRRVRPPRGVFGEGDDRKTIGEGWEDGDEEAGDGKAGDGKAGDKKEWITEVLVFSVGSMRVPVDVEIRFDDGSSLRETWDGKEAWKRIEVTRAAKLSSVRVDPDGKLLLEHRRFDNEVIVRDRETGGAARRAGLRAGWWEQTLLEVMGL